MKSLYCACLLAASMLMPTQAQADDLDQLKAKGEIVIGVKDSSPPFGEFNPKTKTVMGYDIDMGVAVAKRMGLKPVFKTVETGNRVQLLLDRKIDLIMASLGKTPDVAKQVDLSYGYFMNQTKALALKGVIRSYDDYYTVSIGVTAGGPLEKLMRKQFPSAELVTAPDKPELTAMLTSGKVQSIVAAEALLISIWNELPNKQRYEMPDYPINVNPIAIGMRKGETKLRTAINRALTEIEDSGEAERIYERWFGANTTTPIPRTFRINRY